jgi:hypothetical protein
MLMCFPILGRLLPESFISVSPVYYFSVCPIRRPFVGQTVGALHCLTLACEGTSPSPRHSSRDPHTSTTHSHLTSTQLSRAVVVHHRYIRVTSAPSNTISSQLGQSLHALDTVQATQHIHTTLSTALIRSRLCTAAAHSDYGITSMSTLR